MKKIASFWKILGQAFFRVKVRNYLRLRKKKTLYEVFAVIKNFENNKNETFFIKKEGLEMALGKISKLLARNFKQCEGKRKTVAFSVFKNTKGHVEEIPIRSCEKILNDLGWEITIRGQTYLWQVKP